jgi:hypothetical protein
VLYGSVLIPLHLYCFAFCWTFCLPSFFGLLYWQVLCSFFLLSISLSSLSPLLSFSSASFSLSLSLSSSPLLAFSLFSL